MIARFRNLTQSFRCSLPSLSTQHLFPLSIFAFLLVGLRTEVYLFWAVFALLNGILICGG